MAARQKNLTRHRRRKENPPASFRGTSSALWHRVLTDSEQLLKAVVRASVIVRNLSALHASQKHFIAGAGQDYSARFHKPVAFVPCVEAMWAMKPDSAPGRRRNEFPAMWTVCVHRGIDDLHRFVRLDYAYKAGL